jgi:hypothetical protein
MLGVLTGVKVPPYGGRFSPGHPFLQFFGILSLVNETVNNRLRRGTKLPGSTRGAR